MIYVQFVGNDETAVEAFEAVSSLEDYLRV
jgi:hypothetical protein